MTLDQIGEIDDYQFHNIYLHETDKDGRVKVEDEAQEIGDRGECMRQQFWERHEAIGLREAEIALLWIDQLDKLAG